MCLIGENMVVFANLVFRSVLPMDPPGFLIVRLTIFGLDLLNFQKSLEVLTPCEGFCSILRITIWRKSVLSSSYRNNWTQSQLENTCSIGFIQPCFRGISTSSEPLQSNQFPRVKSTIDKAYFIDE